MAKAFRPTPVTVSEIRRTSYIITSAAWENVLIFVGADPPVVVLISMKMTMEEDNATFKPRPHVMSLQVMKQ